MPKFYSGSIVCVLLAIVLILPVTANPPPPDSIYKLYFEKDGSPYNESINYSMKCFGHPTRHIYMTEYLRNKINDDPNPPQVVVYLFGTCDSYGCTKGGWSQLWNPERSELCKLNGTTKEGTFTVQTSSEKPAVKCLTQKKWPNTVCEFFFTLPSGNKTLVVTTGTPESASIEKSPVASLYCTLMNLLGAKC